MNVPEDIDKLLAEALGLEPEASPDEVRNLFEADLKRWNELPAKHPERKILQPKSAMLEAVEFLLALDERDMAAVFTCQTRLKKRLNELKNLLEGEKQLKAEAKKPFEKEQKLFSAWLVKLEQEDAKNRARLISSANEKAKQDMRLLASLAAIDEATAQLASVLLPAPPAPGQIAIQTDLGKPTETPASTPASSAPPSAQSPASNAPPLGTLLPSSPGSQHFLKELIRHASHDVAGCAGPAADGIKQPPNPDPGVIPPSGMAEASGASAFNVSASRPLAATSKTLPVPQAKPVDLQQGNVPYWWRRTEIQGVLLASGLALLVPVLIQFFDGPNPGAAPSTLHGAVPFIPATPGVVLTSTERPRWTNSVGMIFVQVPVSRDGRTKLWVCIWETRRMDFEAYLKARGIPFNEDSLNPANPGSVTWERDHPMVNVVRAEAKDFCHWLTDHERGSHLPGDCAYRLPTDEEWSWVVGIGHLEEAGTPEEKGRRLPGIYPWGNSWLTKSFPKTKRSLGNYADLSAQQNPQIRVGAVDSRGVPPVAIPGYEDGHDGTAPVGTYPPNSFGIFDLGGNALEWCSDNYGADASLGVLRGGCWLTVDPDKGKSSARFPAHPDNRSGLNGFRVVLVAGDTPLQALK